VLLGLTITDVLKLSPTKSQRWVTVARAYARGVYNTFQTDLWPNLSGPTTVGHVIRSLTPYLSILTQHSDSVTRSPLYSMYGETISGVTVLRAFGASSKFLRDMLKSVDTVRSYRSSEKSS